MPSGPVSLTSTSSDASPSGGAAGLRPRSFGPSHAASPTTAPSLPPGYKLETITIPEHITLEGGGLAFHPDGSLYIADSQKGKIWRVMYKK